ncbi:MULTISPECIES: alpha/beta hydrolase [unclassified Streptomyces]|uniref:alpha/beta fold hydrolase n=1 Tax=unclassified Streptomyces TaxID=2593676 RepID=UPI002DDB2786|nr:MULTISPECIES: alpha/beta hydrolase [unclassified Streptomyces]WSA90280.1 alpha/beta hydrolase [Streptomyces sp. NBC_01795]WSB74505.1 alpha/beta hydrolase [Streptomyces sp. NBC_01775]WSS17110.1 alpha/beta hydrolase [Streptomyces sp. NBC_01186]WSS45854.1 alpha/beta hydrolase [Streptomyces sp. NBC_01187]
MINEWTLARTYESANGTVRWAALGDPALPPVVLLHGTPWSSYTWREVARALAASHRVYVWDMPGYGTSAKYEGQDVSLGAQARVFTELLAHWGLERPAVLAHDFGGTVAMRAHLLHGAAFERLALVDVVVAFDSWGSPTYKLMGAHPEIFSQLPPALHRALVREYISSASSPGLHPDVLDRLTEPWLGEAGQPAFFRQIAQNDHRWTREAEVKYGETAMPVLVCWGADDTWIAADNAHELAGRIPGAQLRLIEGAGHLVQEDTPAQLTAALVRFLLDDAVVRR